MDTVTAAIRLADEFGWRIAQLYGVSAPGVCRCRRGEACPSPGKHPVAVDWGLQATADSERIIEEFAPENNIGLLLGPGAAGGGVIDVEYDSAEGREQIEEALRGIELVTPTFRSGRSVHRLFLYQDSFPQIAKIDIDGIEFRLGADGRAAQSVLPPSTHHSGARYEWVEGMSPWDCPVAPLPERLAAKLASLSAAGPQFQMPAGAGDGKINWRRKISTVLRKPGRNYTLYRTACGLFSGSFSIDSEDDITDVLRIIRGVNQTQCVPPLEDAECIEVVKHAAAQRRKDAVGAICTESGIRIEKVGDVIEFTPDTLELTVVKSDPVEYRLYSPTWVEHTDGRTGFVSLSSEQFRNADRVADAVLEQTRVVCLDRFPDEWSTVWDGKRGGKNGPPVMGVKAKLLAAAKDAGRVIDAPRAAKRHVVLAQAIWERLVRATSDDSDRPLSTGLPRKLSDGAVWFRWESIWTELRRWGQVTEAEKRMMQRRLQHLFGGWPTKRRQVGTHKVSYCVWGLREMHLLDEMQAGKEEEHEETAADR